LPFSRIHIKTLAKRVRAAEAREPVDEEGQGGDALGYTTIEALQEQFKTPVWKEELDDESSILRKLLAHPSFSAGEEGQISVNAILAMGLLHSVGEGNEKAWVCYSMLQEGGLEAQGQISASDKDYVKVMDTLFAMSTTSLFSILSDVSTIEHGVSEDDVAALEENFTTVREDQVIDPIYGDNSRLEAAIWHEKLLTSELDKLLFNSSNLREAIFKSAEIDEKWTA